MDFLKILHVDSACKNKSENKIKKGVTVFVFEIRAVEVNSIIHQNYKGYIGKIVKFGRRNARMAL